jgi:hypothetical protein
MKSDSRFPVSSNWFPLHEVWGIMIRFLPRCVSLTKLLVCLDGWMFSGWSSTPVRGPQDGLNVHHGLSLKSQSLIFVFVLGSRKKKFRRCMYLVKIV